MTIVCKAAQRGGKKRVVEIAVDLIPSVDEVHGTVGSQLKAGRERMGLSVSDIAAKTRVPTRHLESIEQSDYDALPGQTYTLGFARSYANVVEMDAAAISDALRLELAQSGHEGYQAPLQNYEPADPARVPSKTLAWTSAAIAVIALVAYVIFRSLTLTDAAPAETSVAAPTAVKAAATAPIAPLSGNTADVVITATDNAWVKIYDADDKRLFEKEMVAGDSFTVPRDANKPMIVTGRPQALAVTVGGKAIPPLGTPDKTIADVGVSADELLARKPAAAAPAE
jgi:cytoskeleton protein RodZ